MSFTSDFAQLVARYNTALPSLTDNCQAHLQLDASGRLIISGRYLEDSGHISGDAGIFTMGVRDDGVLAAIVYDTVTFDADVPGAAGNATLVFDGIDDLDTVINAYNAANPDSTISFSGQAGTYVPAAGSAILAGGADDTIFTDANYDYTPFATDKYGRLKVIADLDVDFDFVHAEDSAHTSEDLGSFGLGIRIDDLTVDNSALLSDTNGDYQGFALNPTGELYVKDADSYAKLCDIDAKLGLLSHAEDDEHNSGDQGFMSLGVQQTADAALAGDGDYAPFQLDENGFLKVHVKQQSEKGDEEYAVTDALAAAADGIIAGIDENWTTVAETSIVGAAESICLYGWDFESTGPSYARLVTDDGTDVKVYKMKIWTSALGGKAEHWGEGARIEIPGAALLQVKVQIKKADANCPDVQGFGSIHARKVS